MDRIDFPMMAAAVIIRLTEAEREELSRKVAEANKRSRDDAAARGGR
ncbi:hypothetical protein [Streptomyces marincola]|nr:hypothetical protein [Streptomyces marincola]